MIRGSSMAASVAVPSSVRCTRGLMPRQAVFTEAAAPEAAAPEALSPEALSPEVTPLGGRHILPIRLRFR